MAKLTQAEVKAKAEEFAGYQKQIDKLEAKLFIETESIVDRHAAEMEKLVAKHEAELKPFNDKYQPKIDKLDTKAASIETEIVDWLKSQKKSITIETENAIAEFFKGKRQSRERVASVPMFLEFVKTKGDEVYKCMVVQLKGAEELIGKKELDAICEKPYKDVEEASLKLK